MNLIGAGRLSRHRCAHDNTIPIFPIAIGPCSCAHLICFFCMTWLAEAELLSRAVRFELAVVLVFISQTAPIFSPCGLRLNHLLAHEANQSHESWVHKLLHNLEMGCFQMPRIFTYHRAPRLIRLGIVLSNDQHCSATELG